MPTSADAMMPGFVVMSSAAALTALDHVISDTFSRPACPIRSAAARSSISSRSATASVSGRGAHTFPLTLSHDQLGRSAAVGAGDDGLARREGFDGDEPVVFVVGRKADGAALREMLEHLAGRRCARSASRATTGPSSTIACSSACVLFPFARDHAADAGRLRIRQRLDQQRQPLQRREPRHGKNIVAVALAAIRRAAAAADTAAPMRCRPTAEAAPRSCATACTPSARSSSADSDRRRESACRRAPSLMRPFQLSVALNASHWS